MSSKNDSGSGKSKLGLISAGIAALAAFFSFYSADAAVNSAAVALDADKVGRGQLFFAALLPCNNYRTLVLNLHDHGLTADQIKAVLNLEKTTITPDTQAESGYRVLDPPRPIYDELLGPSCGDVAEIVRLIPPDDPIPPR